jgi:hypothetical protein
MLTRYSTDAPPGFEGHPLLYLVTVFSLLTINLMALEWLWRLGWQMVERRFPYQHPSSVARVILMSLLVSIVLRAGPDILSLMLWGDMSPAERLTLLKMDGYLDTVSFVPFGVAWVTAFLGGPILMYQLERHPRPLHLWPTWRQVRRPMKIGLAVLAISVATTLFR